MQFPGLRRSQVGTFWQETKSVKTYLTDWKKRKINSRTLKKIYNWNKKNSLKWFNIRKKTKSWRKVVTWKIGQKTKTKSHWSMSWKDVRTKLKLTVHRHHCYLYKYTYCRRHWYFKWQCALFKSSTHLQLHVVLRNLFWFMPLTPVPRTTLASLMLSVARLQDKRMALVVWAYAWGRGVANQFLFTAQAVHCSGDGESSLWSVVGLPSW